MFVPNLVQFELVIHGLGSFVKKCFQTPSTHSGTTLRKGGLGLPKYEYPTFPSFSRCGTSHDMGGKMPWERHRRSCCEPSIRTHCPTSGVVWLVHLPKELSYFLSNFHPQKPESEHQKAQEKVLSKPLEFV